MKQQQITEHILEVGEITNNTWTEATAGMYSPAKTLASQGRLIEAIQAATAIRMENYGEMDDLDFRIVTTTITRVRNDYQ
jgi:hypothetical protein